MGYLTQTQQTYYSGNTYGDYQNLNLSDIIDNFTATYVGEGKILANVLAADVSFHAHRALAELSYDTLKSCKSQEIEVCPNLKMPLPQDYVNYVKLTSVDSNGIEHILYPTSKTSNPFAIEQADTCDSCDDSSSSYQYLATDLKSQEIECDSANVTCEFYFSNMVFGIHTFEHLGALEIYQALQPGGGGSILSLQSNNVKHDYWTRWMGNIDQYCLCLESSGAADNCGPQLSWTGFSSISDLPDNLSQPQMILRLQATAGWTNLRASTGVINLANAVGGIWPSYTTTVISTTPTSNTWDNYSSSGGNSVAIDQSTTTSLAADTDNYFQNTGQRYGLDPQYAQANGSYFIDCAKGMIHFSSNLSGKTIILKYISDSLGTDGEMLVPKLAEEAIYKWILYGCLLATAGVPPGFLSLIKKEKYSETRKAKIRLSNIKLEEISQIIRGVSKHIKH